MNCHTAVLLCLIFHISGNDSGNSGVIDHRSVLQTIFKVIESAVKSGQNRCFIPWIKPPVDSTKY